MRGRIYRASQMLKEIYLRNYEQRTNLDPFTQGARASVSSPSTGCVMESLLIFCRFPHHPCSGLVEVLPPANVAVELRGYFLFGLGLVGVSRLKLFIAVFADAEGGRGRPLYNSQVTLWHTGSFPQADLQRHSCGFQTAPLPDLCPSCISWQRGA